LNEIRETYFNTTGKWSAIDSGFAPQRIAHQPPPGETACPTIQDAPHNQDQQQ